jgi:hypothetical protein
MRAVFACGLGHRDHRADPIGSGTHQKVVVIAEHKEELTPVAQLQ